MLIAGPNLTIDRTMELDELRAGRVLRAGQVTVSPGGKGLNVARTAKALDQPSELVGFVPGRMGAVAAEMIAEEQVRLRGVPAAGEIRSTAVLLEAGGRTTVINEPGPTLGPDDWSRYEGEVDAGLRQGVPALICSGSVPPGTPPDAYARLVGLARTAGCLSVVDAAGELLVRALEAGADVVSPNLSEAEAVLHGAGDEEVAAGEDASRRAVEAAAALHARGARIAVVTAAEAGVAAVDGDGRWWVPAVDVPVRNTIGAGDAFATAFTIALAEPAGLSAALRRGVATSAASVMCGVGGQVDAADARSLLDRVAEPTAV